MEIKLGSEVKDVVTGCKGIAVGRTTWLNGCVRVGIQQPMKKDGTVPETQWMDEEQLAPLKVKVKIKPKRVGGPRKDPHIGMKGC